MKGKNETFILLIFSPQTIFQAKQMADEEIVFSLVESKLENAGGMMEPENELFANKTLHLGNGH